MSEFIGLDVSKEETSYCILDAAGDIVSEGKALSEPLALFEAFRSCCLCPERIVLETGTLCHWLARGLQALGLPAEIIDARHAHGVMKLQRNKSDAKDARLLAEMARTGFCRRVAVRSATSQKRTVLLKARQHLVRQRRDGQNTIRGLLGAFGIRLPRGSWKLAERVREVLQGEDQALSQAIVLLLRSCDALEREIKLLDKGLLAEARASRSAHLLMTVPGVGPVTAMAYLACVDDAKRFCNSHSVGAYIGLTSRRHQSGELDYSGRISKYGDNMLRSLLYEAAHSMLCVVRRAHPLKDWARRLRKRASHKKACLALARKLAVIMHKMLINNQPFRWPAKEAGQKA